MLRRRGCREEYLPFVLHDDKSFRQPAGGARDEYAVGKA